jgi:predicted nucleic acid-binding protein
MTEFVIDASALLEIVTGTKPDPVLRRTVLTGQGAAPELLDVEAASYLRRSVLHEGADPEDAGAALTAVGGSPITRVSHRTLMSRIWELRGAITAYDAAYVALAEQLGVPLLTCDARLGRANGHRAEIVAFPVA